MQAGLTVYVIDDDADVRGAMRAIAGSAGLMVQDFDSAEAFLESCTGGERGCILLDLRLRGMSGLHLLEALRDRLHFLPVIIITGHGDIAAAVQAMKLGAMDFLEKPIERQVVLEHIRAAMLECEARCARAQVVADAHARLACLTSRERQMLNMVISGKSSKQIAHATGLSVKTVNNHRAHLLAKTGAENTADLVRLTMVSGMCC